MDPDQYPRLAYLLVLLILPVMALVRRFRPGNHRPTVFTAQLGDQTYEGVWWVDDGIVYVRCEAGQRGSVPGPQGALHTAEQVLVDLYRNRDHPPV